jgi:hypothetical protein
MPRYVRARNYTEIDLCVDIRQIIEHELAWSETVCTFCSINPQMTMYLFLRKQVSGLIGSLSVLMGKVHFSGDLCLFWDCVLFMVCVRLAVCWRNAESDAYIWSKSVPVSDSVFIFCWYVSRLVFGLMM